MKEAVELRKFDDLAKELQLTKPTIQQHLRTAEKKVVPFLTENIM